MKILKFIITTLILLMPFTETARAELTDILESGVVKIGVPESSVTIQGDTAFVYVVKDNIVEKRNIKIGKRNFGKVSITSGLKEGEVVVSEGVSKVRNKAKVKIVNTQK